MICGKINAVVREFARTEDILRTSSSSAFWKVSNWNSEHRHLERRELAFFAFVLWTVACGLQRCTVVVLSGRLANNSKISAARKHLSLGLGTFDLLIEHRTPPLAVHYPYYMIR